MASIWLDLRSLRRWNQIEIVIIPALYTYIYELFNLQAAQVWRKVANVWRDRVNFSPVDSDQFQRAGAVQRREITKFFDFR